MKLSNAAIGLAAVGAGLLVARMLRNRDAGGGATEYVGGNIEPPEPNRLIGYPPTSRSAREAADTFGAEPGRPI